MLNILESFANRYSKIPGFELIVKDLSLDVRKQKGAEFISRILKDKAGVTAFEFKYIDELNNTADFVLNTKLIDGKSWSVTGSINKIGGWDLSKQLKDYFKNDEIFELWFDYSRFKKSKNSSYSKMTKDQAVKHIKEQYQKLFLKESKAQELFDYMGETRFIEEFQVDNIDDFLDVVVPNLNNTELYGFIKVK